jgi:LysM repeat protein
MSTIVAFTPARTRRALRPVAEVVPIETAPSARRRALAAGLEGMAGAGAAPLRLTRRGRLVAGAALSLVLLLVISAGVLLLGQQAVAGEQARPVPARVHVVTPGETLWSIAGRVAPGADRRDVVARLREFNALSSVALQAGQRIAIPGDVSAG